MKRNVQYVMLGAGVTVLVFLGAFALLLSRAQADGVPGPVSSSPAGESPHDVTTATGQSNETAAPPPANDDAPAPVAENPTQLPGTPDDPETDTNVIVSTIEELVAKREAEILGQPGWFYRRYESEIPREYFSNTGDIYGVPVTELYGFEGPMLHEEWSFVDEKGYFHEKVGWIIDRQSVTRNRWAITGGKMINLDLVDATERAIHEAANAQRVSFAGNLLWYLDVAQSSKQPATAKAWNEDGKYVVIFEGTYDEPVTMANLGNATVIGNHTKHVFDPASGALLTLEFSYRKADGSISPFETVTFLEESFVPRLPLEAMQVLNEAAELAQEKE